MHAAPSALVLMVVAALAGCGGASPSAPVDRCAGVTCGAHAACVDSGNAGICTCVVGHVGDPAAGCVASSTPAVGGCLVFPANHLFNTPIDALPVHPQSADFLATLGDARLHPDLGTTVDQASAEYYGIPFNVVHGAALTWSRIYYGGGWPWESDCASAAAPGVLVRPCQGAGLVPVFPVPPSPLVEGGLTDPGNDHHLLVVDADACRLWEAYHAMPHAGGGWDVLSTASWDLSSNALRPDHWTAADAAGFPMVPLLLKRDEAASGTIRHALRVTLPYSRIRNTYVWPARHVGGGSTSASAPEMGQLFRLKASYVIPAGTSVQGRAILQALKTYGMYVADATVASTWFIQGEPNAGWDGRIWSEIWAVRTASLEAVDLAPIRSRAGWSADSGAVPPP